MSQKIKVGGTWRDVLAPYVKVSGVWKPAKAVYHKVNGLWKSSFLQGGLDDSTFTIFDNYNGISGNLSGSITLSDGKFVLGFNGGYSWNGIQKVNGILSFNTDGTINSSFQNAVTSANYFTDVVATVQRSDNAMIFAGTLGSGSNYTWRICKINADGTEDTSFRTNIGTTVLSQNYRAMFPQSDGKIIVLGGWVSWNGVEQWNNPTTMQRGIVRLNTDGTRDTAFNNNMGTGPDNDSFAGVQQSDGKLLIVGLFVNWSGTTVNGIVRLNSNGTRDTSFNPNSSGVQAWMNAVKVQSDGKILVGGNFTNWNGVTRNRLVRLNSDGSIDTTFQTNIGTAANNEVKSIEIQSDGKILVGGSFTTWNGATVNRLVRLNSDGTRDLDFSTNIGSGFDSTVLTIAVSGTKLNIGGYFSVLNGKFTNKFVRLNLDGTIDSTFLDFSTKSSTSETSAINDLEQFSNGKILISGTLKIWNNTQVNRLALLNPDGTLDQSFNSNTINKLGSTDGIYGIALQDDGKIILFGYFSSWNGAPYTANILRLNADYTEDTVFRSNISAGTNGGAISDCFIQADGKIIIIAPFASTWNGVAISNSVLRLNSDGTRDTSFSVPALDFAADFGYIFQTSKKIVQYDSSSLLLAETAYGYDASFSYYMVASSVKKISTSGVLDSSFNANVPTKIGGATDGLGNISSVSVRSDGKIVVGGNFNLWSGTSVPGLVLLNSNGTRDTSFQTNIGTAGSTNTSSILYSAQKNNKIVAVGKFTSWNGLASNGIVRLNADGTFDTAFNNNVGSGFGPESNFSNVFKILHQIDGKILVAGSFAGFSGKTRSGLLRIGGDIAT